MTETFFGTFLLIGFGVLLGIVIIWNVLRYDGDDVFEEGSLGRGLYWAVTWPAWILRKILDFRIVK